MEPVERLTYWIKERHQIYLRKGKALPKPWTDDAILQTYKFCNPYRENDRVTVWIKDNIRTPFADHTNLWLMLAIARRINWPDTLAELIADKKAWPYKNYDPEAMLSALDARTRRKEQVYTGAYMITAEHVIGETKSRATAYSNLGRLWDNRKHILPHLEGGSLGGAFGAILGSGFAWGSFMTAQLICDLKYTRYLEDAPDWRTWAASGPGSKRGLNRVLGREVDAPWKEEEWLGELLKLKAKIDPLVAKAKMPPLHAQDLQNCLCEFDKYERVRLGQGRPRSKYPGI